MGNSRSVGVIGERSKWVCNTNCGCGSTYAIAPPNEAGKVVVKQTDDYFKESRDGLYLDELCWFITPLCANEHTLYKPAANRFSEQQAIWSVTSAFQQQNVMILQEIWNLCMHSLNVFLFSGKITQNNFVMFCKIFRFTSLISTHPSPHYLPLSVSLVFGR